MTVPSPSAKPVAPRGDGAVLLLPEPASWRGLVASNRRLIEGWSFPVAGRPVAEVRARLRNLVATASRNLAKRLTGRSPAPVAPDAPFIVAGHQPELEHPGVWVKHLVIRRLAVAMGGAAFHLIADGDVPKSGDLALPVVTGGRVSVRTVRWAGFEPSTAMRGQAPLDRVRLLMAASEARRALREAGLPDDGLEPFWATLAAASSAMGPSGALPPALALAAARMAVEAGLGVRNREFLLSRGMITPLLHDLSADAARFRTVHNAALEGFRRRHRVRSAGRPVPSLEERGPRVELPFWVWAKGGPRRRLFVQPVATVVAPAAPGDVPGSEAPASTTTIADPRPAWRWTTEDGAPLPREAEFAPRALALTMLVRVLVADLFVHGIGGAVYDEVTDDVVRGWFGVEPPAYAVASATLHLPLPVSGATAARRGGLLRRLRDLRWNAGRMLSGEAGEPPADGKPAPSMPLAEIGASADEVRALLAEREALLRRDAELRLPTTAGQPPETGPARQARRAARRTLYRRRQEVDARLARLAEPLRTATEAEMARTEADLASDRVARSREWFTGLYPAAKLRSLLDSLPEM